MTVKFDFDIMKQCLKFGTSSIKKSSKKEDSMFFNHNICRYV